MNELEVSRRRRPRFVWLGAIVVTLVMLVGLFALMIIANNRPPTGISLPTHAVPKDNGWDYFIKAAKTAKRSGPLSVTGGDKWTMAEYELFMRDNAPALKILQEGLTKPCVSPSMRDTASVSKVLPCFASLREYARTLCGAAMYYEKRGDYGSAVDRQLDCIEMGVTIPNKGPLIVDLVGIAITAIGAHGIEKNLPKLNEAELARAAARMQHIKRDMASYGEVVLEESCCTASQYLEVFGTPGYAASALNPANWTDYDVFGNNGKPKAMVMLTNAKMVTANKTVLLQGYLDYSQQLSTEARRPYTGKLNTSTDGNLLAEGLASLTLRGWQTHAYCEATIALIEAEIAVRRYKATNGIYPKNLSDLAPAYLNRVPTDPFGGKPLGYRQLNGGKDFVLYSIGQNLIDDGGKPHISPGARDTGDILLGSL